jgi:hypothetical protein
VECGKKENRQAAQENYMQMGEFLRISPGLQHGGSNITIKHEYPNDMVKRRGACKIWDVIFLNS